MKLKRKYTIVYFWIFFLSATIQIQELPTIAEEPSSFLINEVMCHPTENENTNEWIELFNPSDETIDVSGWMIADEKETDIIQGDNQNGDGTTSIPPGGYALITDMGTTVYETALVADNTIRLSVDDSTLCGYGLNNQKEKLILFNQEGTIIDAMEWGDDYDDVPGSPASVPPKGFSLSRSEITDTDDSSLDFFEATPTPGAKNDVIPQEDPGEYSEDDQDSIVESEDDFLHLSYPLLITELYYDTHPNINAEYIRIMNPTNTTVDVSGFYLTDEPWDEPGNQPKILFPDHTLMPSNTSWYIAKNATAFLWETAFLPTFEYAVDSLPQVPQLSTDGTVAYSSIGGLVGFYSVSQTLIDIISYGETDQSIPGWEGPSINSSGQGIILKRNNINGTLVDTNTSSDWIHSRIYHIGQSEFPLQTFISECEITVFVSPDNSYGTIRDELRNARRSIDINMYEFTNPFLFDELVDALHHNVTVRLFMEGSPIGGIDEREKIILSELAAHNALIRFLVSDYEKQVYARYEFTHAKYLIIDNETVIIESANWAKTGIPKDPSFGNREWGLVVRNPEVAMYFLKVFQEDWNPLHHDSYSIEAMDLAISPGFFLDYEYQFGSYQPCFSSQTFTSPSCITPVFSPDTSEQAILDAIDNATSTIYIQQLYIYSNWEEIPSPLVQRLINKSHQNVTIKVILDYNQNYEETIAMLNTTKEEFESYGIAVKFISSEWSPFSTIHNKGMIIDNTTVLISSINWNEQSIRKNREAGLLVKNQEIAGYYATVFLSDWNLEAKTTSILGPQPAEYKYLLWIAVVFGITFMLIARDWRKRKWR